MHPVVSELLEKADAENISIVEELKAHFTWSKGVNEVKILQKEKETLESVIL